MTYLDPTYRDVTDVNADRDDKRFVFLGTRQAVPLRTEVEEEALAPEGTVAVQVYRRDVGSRIGQFAAPRDGLERFRRVLEQPRRIGMGCTAEYPGLVGQLLALVPISDLGELLGNLEEEPDQPWKENLPEPPELETGGPGAPPGMEGGHDPVLDGAGDDEGFEGASPEDAGRTGWGALHLGNVVRFEDDRVYRGAFLKEATDMFRKAVKGDLPHISERLIDELAANAPTDD